MKISSNDTSSTENLLLRPSTNVQDNDGVQPTPAPLPEPEELGEQNSDEELVAVVLDSCLSESESKRHEFEAESSITSADFEPSPTEAELVFGSLRLTKSERSTPPGSESEDLGSPAFSDTISTKSCVVLPLEEGEDSDLSIETHVATSPENGLLDYSSRTEEVHVSQSTVVSELEQGNSESAKSHSQTGPPNVEVIPGDIENSENLSVSAKTDPEPTAHLPLPPSGPLDKSPTEELGLLIQPEHESKSDYQSDLSRSEASVEATHSDSLPSDHPPTAVREEIGSKEIEPTVAPAPLSEEPHLDQSVAHLQSDSEVLPPIAPPVSIPEPIVNLDGIVTLAEIASDVRDILLIGNNLNDPPSIPAIENDHVLELEKEETSNTSSFQDKVLDPPSVPLPNSLDTSFEKINKSGDLEGVKDLLLLSGDSTKSQEVETDESPQDAQNPSNIKIKSKGIEELSDEGSDEETFVKPNFDVKMKYKAIDQDHLSPVHPVFNKDSSHEIVIEPIHGSAEALRQRVKKPFVLRLFKGKELDEQVIHSDQDISDTMRRICEDCIDEFEIEELMTTDGHLPTPKSAEFPRDEEGKMYKTKTMDLFSLLDQLRRKSSKYSSERDEDTLDQETLAALIADDFAREKARMEVSENDESHTTDVKATSTTTKSTTLTSEVPTPVVKEEDPIETLARDLLLSPSEEQQDQIQRALNSPVELPALIGNPPDQAQIQRLLRFMGTLTDLITGHSSVKEPKKE